MTRRRTANPQGTYARIYAVVKRIPRGKVATYGQVAARAGLPGRARQVGYALAALTPATAVPWQRVVNTAGRISLAPMRGGISQRLLLEHEGIRFTGGDRISLDRFGWRPRG